MRWKSALAMSVTSVAFLCAPPPGLAHGPQPLRMARAQQALDNYIWSDPEATIYKTNDCADDLPRLVECHVHVTWLKAWYDGYAYMRLSHRRIHVWLDSVHDARPYWEPLSGLGYVEVARSDEQLGG